MYKRAICHGKLQVVQLVIHTPPHSGHLKRGIAVPSRWELGGPEIHLKLTQE